MNIYCKPFVIYDPISPVDNIAACWAIECSVLNGFDFCPFTNKQEIQNVSNRTIYILGLIYPTDILREVIVDLSKRNERVVIIANNPASESVLFSLPINVELCCTNNRHLAIDAWMKFNENVAIPKILRVIEDRNFLKIIKEENEDIYTGLVNHDGIEVNKHPKESFDFLDALNNGIIGKNMIDELRKEGHIINRYINKQKKLEDIYDRSLKVDMR